MQYTLFQQKKYSRLFREITDYPNFYTSQESLQILAASAVKIIKRNKPLDKSYKALISTYLSANQHINWTIATWEKYFGKGTFKKEVNHSITYFEKILNSSPNVTETIKTFYQTEKEQYDKVFEIMSLSQKDFMPSPTFARFFRLEEIALQLIVEAFRKDSKAKVFHISKWYNTREYYPNLSHSTRTHLMAFTFMNKVKQYFYKQDSTKALDATKLYNGETFALKSFPALQFQLMDDLGFVLSILHKDKLPTKTVLNLYLCAMRVCPGESNTAILPDYMDFLEQKVVQTHKKTIHYLNYYVEAIRLFPIEKEPILKAADIIKNTLLDILDRVGVIDFHTKGRQSRRKVNDTYLFLKEIILEVSKLKTLYDQRWRAIFTEATLEDLVEIRLGLTTVVFQQFSRDGTGKDGMEKLNHLLTLAKIPKNKRGNKHNIFTKEGIMIGEILVLIDELLGVKL